MRDSRTNNADQKQPGKTEPQSCNSGKRILHKALSVDTLQKMDDFSFYWPDLICPYC